MIFKRLNRMLLILLGLFLLAIVVVVGLLHTLGDRALKLGIETAGTKALNVGVTVDNASFSLLRGRLILKNLTIHNPTGYDTPKLFEIDRMEIEADLPSFLGKTVHIKKIYLDAAGLTVEQKGLSNNLQEVLDHVANSKPKSTEPKQPSQGKDVLVDDLDITNTKVQVKLLPIPGRAEDLSINLSPIQIRNLSSDKPITAAELIVRILGAVADGLAKQGGDMLPREIIGPLKSILEPGGILDSGKQVLDKTIQDIQKPAGEILKQSQDLLNIVGGKKEKK
jgi:uncharacterized protein involved in outer membrane biogenesis